MKSSLPVKGMKFKIIFSNGSKSTSSSTLLIPEELLSLLEKKVAVFGSLENLFHFIVGSSHSAFQDKPRVGNSKICYQRGGFHLKRVDFFPNTEDWEKFRTYAWCQRVSMTLLFVKILSRWNEFKRLGSIVPRKTEKIQVHQSLTIHEIFSYLELEHLIL